MKNLIKLLLVGLIFFTSCNKDELVQPNVEVFTTSNLTGEWFASENTINNISKYKVYNLGDVIYVDSFDTLNYKIELINSRTIYIEDKYINSNYILLRR